MNCGTASIKKKMEEKRGNIKKIACQKRKVIREKEWGALIKVDGKLRKEIKGGKVFGSM